jgi:hypothetical protein
MRFDLIAYQKLKDQLAQKDVELNNIKSERDALRVEIKVCRGFLQEICNDWNEDCDPGCDSWGHKYSCKSVNIANAKKALHAEICRLREALKQCTIYSECYEELILTIDNALYAAKGDEK